MNSESFSLADFAFNDSENPLQPAADFMQWRQETAALSSLYEPSLMGAPEPHVEVSIAGQARPVINMGSYNYLGLARHPETVAAAQVALEQYGTGACGSPLLSGMTDLHRRLEVALSRFLRREDTLLFNSGFSGALGTLSALLHKGDIAVLDSKSHMSLIDGAMLARARIEFFTHNDPDALDAVLARNKGKRQLVAVEGIYSMDGDMADLPALLEVAAHHGAGVLVDEAHSILTCGENGRGATEHFGVEEHGVLQGRQPLIYGTFSKAFAGLGGFVSGSTATLDYLRCYARSYTFSCALPPATVASCLQALEIATRDNTLRARLWDNAAYFRTQLQGLGLDIGESTTQVVPIIIGSDRRLLYELGHELIARGLFLAPVDYPAVAEDQVRYRASITALHSRQDLDEALNILQDTVVPRLKRTV